LETAAEREYHFRVSKLIGELLVEAKALTREQLEEALRLTRDPGKKIGHVLVEQRLVTEAQLTQSLSLQLAVPWVSLYHIDFSRQLLTRVPREIAEQYCLVPIYVRTVKGSGETLYVATEDPTNQEALAAAAKASGLPVRPMIASPSDIRSAIRVYYGGAASGEDSGKDIAPSPPAQPSAPAQGAISERATTSPDLRASAAAEAKAAEAKAVEAKAVEAKAAEAKAEAKAAEAKAAAAEARRNEPPPLPPRRPAKPPPPPSDSAPGSRSSPDVAAAARSASADTGAHALAAATGPLAPHAPPPPSRPPPPPTRSEPRRSDMPPKAGPPSGPDSPDAAPEIEAREITVKRGPRMVALTLLHGTSLTLPARTRRRSEAPPAGISEQLTSRDLVAALRALSHGADVTEILGDNVHWEAMFAALLSILLKKGIIADWEFVEELRKV
jgi:type IV pilus assembly protein PilB